MNGLGFTYSSCSGYADCEIEVALVCYRYARVAIVGDDDDGPIAIPQCILVKGATEISISDIQI